MSMIRGFLALALTVFAVQGMAQTNTQGPAEPVQAEEPQKLEVTLNGYNITSMEQVHEILAKELKFPSYYGKNLDALYDMLVHEQVEVVITIINAGLLSYNIGEDKVQAILDTLNSAQEANSKIMVWFWQ